MDKMVDFLKLPTKIWVVLAIAGTSVLASQPIAEKFYGGHELYVKYGIWVFFVTVLAWAFLLVEIFLFFWNKQAAKNNIRRRVEYVNNLTEDKKEIVRHLYDKPDHVIELRVHAEQVKELETNMVIGKASTQKMIVGPEEINDPLFPYILEPWVIQKIDTKEITI